jgi:hypothetical protein
MRVSLARPGERLPGEYTGPAQGSDFSWVKTGWLDRLRGRQAMRAVAELTDGLREATGYNHQSAAYEQSKQAVALARGQAEFLPLKLEQERTAFQLGIMQTQCAISDALEKRERAQAEHQRVMIDQKGRTKVAKARNKSAKRARREARQAAREARYAMREQPPTRRPTDAGPAFNRHFRTMQEAKRNLSEGERRIQAIYAAAAAERRHLTADEMLEVDAINDAAQAARDEVRRSGASDFRP